MDPELSVIVVNWNTREMTLECLRSLKASTRRTTFETIVVDNGSADGSAEAIAQAFPEVRLLAETVNHGFAKANNIAAAQARGQYLLLLNSDTVVLDGAIDALMEFARSRPTAGIWGGRTIFPDGRLNPGSAWGRLTFWSSICFALGLVKAFPQSALFNPEGIGGWKRDTVREVDIVSGCYFLIQTALWRELGGFDPAFFMYGEEADLCARARKRGARPATTPASTIVHYGGASTAHVPNKLVYLFGSKIGLAQRHLAPLSSRLTQVSILVAVAWRALAYATAARFRSKWKDQAIIWREVWRRRGEWRRGPLTAPISSASRCSS